LIDTGLSAAICIVYRKLRGLQHQMRPEQQNAQPHRAGLAGHNPVLELWKKLLGE